MSQKNLLSVREIQKKYWKHMSNFLHKNQARASITEIETLVRGE